MPLLSQERTYCFSVPPEGKLRKQPQKSQLKQPPRKPTHNKIKETADEDQSPAGAAEYQMYNCRASGNQPLIVQLRVQDTPISMEVDTGATLSIISRHTYNTSWPKTQAPPIHPTNAKLRSYTGEEIPVNGSIEVEVTYQDQRASPSSGY